MDFIKTTLAFIAALFAKDAIAGLWTKYVPTDFDWKAFFASGAGKVKPWANTGAALVGYGVLALALMHGAKGCNLPPLPIPWPAPGPAPTPEPPAPQIGKLRVLVVVDKNNVANLPRAQQDIINLPKDVREYLSAHCGVGEDGKTPEYRFFDYQQDVSGASVAWKAGFAKAQGKQLPYLVVANETASWEGALPANTGDFLNLLRKYGGQ